MSAVLMCNQRYTLQVYTTAERTKQIFPLLLNSIQFLSTGARILFTNVTLSVVFKGRIENNVDNFSQDRVLVEFIKLPKNTK